MKIHDVALEDRPRERLLTLGPQALSSAELLAILISTGTEKENSIQVAQKILALYPLRQLAHIQAEHLMQCKGIGTAKACTLLSALELGRRVQGAKKEKQISSMEDFGPRYVKLLGTLGHEEVHAIYLNARRHILKEVCITKGTTDASLISSRDIYKQALLCNATAVIVIHNHPSGDPTPSEEDRKVTKSLLLAGMNLGIALLDHMVVGREGYKSCLE